MKKHFSRGFSLVELLIVIAIIGILATVAMPAYFNHVLRLRQQNVTDVLLELKRAQEMYLALNDGYATTTTQLQTVTDVSFSNTWITYSIAAANTNSFTYRAQADLNRDGQKKDVWIITDALAQPQTSLGQGHVEGGEGFNFSLVGQLF